MKEPEILIRRIANKTWTLSVVACALWVVAPAYAAPSNYVSFDPPNSIGTQPQCINPAGTVVGYDFGQDTLIHGFLRTASGTIVTIDHPNAVFGTYALGVNAAGTVVGVYSDASSNEQGFLWSASGGFVDVQVPNAIETITTSINDSGAVLGSFVDTNDVFHGFIRAANGTITTFDVPNARVTLTAFIVNQFAAGCSGLSNSGTATGVYEDSNGNLDGFVRSASGTFATFAVPNATFGTQPAVISPSGTVAGAYNDQSGIHSFERSPTGVVTPFDPSNGSTSSLASVATGINPAGTAVGSALLNTTNFAVAGWVKSARGTVTFFEFPGNSQTYGSAINPAGTVAGYYFDQNGQQHGFVATSPY